MNLSLSGGDGTKGSKKSNKRVASCSTGGCDNSKAKNAFAKFSIKKRYDLPKPPPVITKTIDGGLHDNMRDSNTGYTSYAGRTYSPSSADAASVKASEKAMTKTRSRLARKGKSVPYGGGQGYNTSR